MVTEFLDVSKYQVGKDVIITTPDVKVEPLVKEVVEELEFLAEQKKIYLKVEIQKEGLPTISADKERIKAVLFNVVDNAVKYTNEGGVTVKIETKSGKIIISVKDNGIGIPKEKLSGIFKVNYERDPVSKKVNPGGRGIGMYLSAKIIEGHKGRIWVESGGEGKGSTFYIELPIEEIKLKSANEDAKTINEKSNIS